MSYFEGFLKWPAAIVGCTAVFGVNLLCLGLRHNGHMYGQLERWSKAHGLLAPLVGRVGDSKEAHIVLC